MAFVTFEDFKAWANENHREEFASLPPASIYIIEVRNETFTFETGKKVKSVSSWLYETVEGICIGEMQASAVDTTADDFSIAKVYAYLDSDLLQFAVDETKIDSPDIQYARLDEPYTWLSDVEADNDALESIDALLRYHLLANQRIEGIDVDGNFQTQFIRACQNIAKGQIIRKRVVGIKDPIYAQRAETANQGFDQNDISGLKDHLRSLTEDVEVLKSSSHPFHQNLRKEIADLKVHIGSLESENKELQAEVQNFNEKDAHHSAALRDWQDKHVAAVEAADVWKQKYDKLKGVMHGAIEEAE